MSLWTRIFGDKKAEARELRERRNAAQARFRATNSAIQAATRGAGSSWNGIQTVAGDDSLNKEYLTNLAEVQSRAQDHDVNNPDIKGFHRMRAAQIVGKGVSLMHAPHADEIAMEPDAASALAHKINRLRHIHSRLGGFDSAGLGRSEGKQQERAVLTSLVLGCCLIHKVWRTDPRYPLPLSLELIPGSRISTPYDKSGDPLVSFGTVYSDQHRSRVVGWWVRRVSKTVGNSFVIDPTWDFVPVEDGSLLSLTEIAGIDRALPLSTAVIRMVRNRGEFVENAVVAARNQSKNYAHVQCAPNASPFDVAADDAAAAGAPGAAGAGNPSPMGFVDYGGGVQMMYGPNGEIVNFLAPALPQPLAPFMAATDSRMARGLVASLSRFTREVNNSWAGGRLEDQQDDPIIEQYRDAFKSAWQKVNGWFLEACWMSGAIELPGYSRRTAALWAEFRATFPGKVHINPQDTEAARETGLMHRTLTPQEICEQDGTNFEDQMRHWAAAMKIVRDAEKQAGLEQGSLDILFSGRAMTSADGDEIGAAAPVTEPGAGGAADAATRRRGDAANGANGGGRRNGAAANAMFLNRFSSAEARP